MSNFKNDLLAEQELGKYLDKYFYPRLGVISNVCRITEKNEQYLGVDLSAVISGNSILIDEKGYLSIPNIGKTFVLELSYFNKEKKLKVGWLFDESKKTTHYLFCWNKRNEEIKHSEVKEKDFHYIMAMLVDRQKLLKYLKDTYGVSKETARFKVQEIIEKNKFGSLETLNENTKSKFYYTKDRVEKPINIVMRKEELAKICEGHYLVKRTELKKV
ncbi:hypothetical protein M2M59_11945 [Rummeliibacillus sp. G93]|uniref:hypothetical protein n=1 Tax=Rummeliibacillus sp. G93 TaxID=2939494 RepID=UPI00201BEA86|nr:hypothetical protein [Rummeliibacillus sp. G93]UQW96674.1 hypothetical protein M2M59_11945 [Rummeliibacillus sp. G93]